MDEWREGKGGGGMHELVEGWKEGVVEGWTRGLDRGKEGSKEWLRDREGMGGEVRDWWR